MVKWLPLLFAGCATQLHRPPQLSELLPRAPYTVIEFFSATCPCQRAHDPRVRQWAEQFADVQFVAVDSEADANEEKDDAERVARGYDFPLLTDAEGRWADMFAASYATYSVVVDPSGKVVYRGGLDSDRQHLTPDAKLYLRDALAALSRGEAPPNNETKALGCALQRR